jgi:hypothetical protein
MIMTFFLYQKPILFLMGAGDVNRYYNASSTFYEAFNAKFNDELYENQISGRKLSGGRKQANFDFKW